MDEPNRIGLSAKVNAQLEDLLKDLNSQEGGVELIKRDLYRLAVALGIKNAIDPSPLDDKNGWKDRVSEFDPDRSLYTAAENSGLATAGASIYEFIERHLA